MKYAANKKVVYYLSLEDIQIVASENIGRELTLIEVEKIKDSIAKRINWYDVILDAISDQEFR